jgi:hypothetical protein
MSVAAMADNRLLLAAPAQVPNGAPAVVLPGGGKVAGVNEGTLNSIVQWIPIETIGVYVFLQSLFLSPLNPPVGVKLDQLDFSSRWHIFFIGLAITTLSIPLYTAMKAKQATASFKFPLGETVIGTVAFVLWALALPDTPASDWKDWTPHYGVAAIAVTAIFLNPIAVLLNIKAQWGKTVPPPPDPAPVAGGADQAQ